MNVHRANAGELAEAESLLQEYYEAIGVVKRDSPGEVQSFLSDPAGGFWIAREEQHAAGCVVLRALPSFPRAAECKRLYVRPQFRGSGIANLLLDAMENYARSAGYESVYLDSKDDLLGALRLYKRRGYEACDRYNDNPQATVFLRRSLEGLRKSTPSG